ncbi:MAG: hypothetical protein FJ109_10270 [Deltaproteobacteria bacterium]|nr:hypothetical protein [Deltaproteobacteria bacterium]
MTDDLKVTYRRSRPEDEAELRALLHRTPLPGPIRLSMRKEPDFFAAMAVEGERTDVLVAEDVSDGRLVGVGARSEKPCFVNGADEPVTVGYLSNLRIEAPYRGGKILKAGYQQMERMHREGSARVYTTTILEGNIPAIKALTSGRPGLPLYRDFGPFHSFMLSARALPVKADGPFDTTDATPDDIDELIRFWHTEGRRRQFFPAYRAQHLAGDCAFSSPPSCGAATLAAATPVQGAPLRSGSSTPAVSSSPPSCGAATLAAATPVQGAPLRSGSSTPAVSSSPPSCGAATLAAAMPVQGAPLRSGSSTPAVSSSPPSCGAATLAAATPVQGAPLRSGSSTAAVSSSPPSCGGLLSGLGVADIAVARDCRGIAGTAALWDQTAFRQWFVEGYSGGLALARPAYNLAARLLRRPALPAPGTSFAYRFLALLCIRDDRPEVLRALLAHLGRRCRADRFTGLVVAGCATRDPLCAALASLPHVLMRSRLYVVHWDDGRDAFDALDKALVPYLEVGGL